MLGAAGAATVVVAALVVVVGWHLTQGTTGVGARDLVDAVLGRADRGTVDVLVDSRLPRMLAGLTVGIALGVAGAVFQSLARNALASPDTLAVNAGAVTAVTTVAAFGITVPFVGNTFVAFGGALLAAGLVLVLAGGGSTSTTRLILAGSALALALDAVGTALLLLFDQETTGLFAWGRGTLSQTGLDGVRAMGPLVALTVLATLLLARRLDLLSLGDDAASSLGVPVLRSRVVGTLLAVLLCACAVNLAGPIGFVGLAAPALVRLAARVVPSVSRHLVLLPLAGLVGALVVLLTDATVRSVIGAEASLRVPTGVSTTMVGAVALVVLARQARDAGPTRRPASARPGALHGRLRFLVVVAVLVVLVVGAGVVGILGGYQWFLVGDVLNWLRGDAVPVVAFGLEERAPRVVAALLAGAALALAGTTTQAVCRNPLAEPSILGVTGGAAAGAVIVVTSVDSPSTAQIALAAGVGAILAMVLVYAVTWRGSLDPDRLVLVGIGVAAFGASLCALLLVYSDPFNTPALYTWLSGSTYGRTWGQVVPVAVVLVVTVPLAWLMHRELDLLALDDETPRLVGVRLERLRLLALAVAALLAATAV
ncbi:iron chelate uptake ABC transporter family permease subunit, partial [Nocardioides sp.]|uniref:iron chelate uptake ABC transporter family permease subunit n=1 Tax=Nocardioides sp. TaxID=35761 RepID=UPI002727250A